MPSSEILQKLSLGAEAWNSWRRDNRERYVDLTDARLPSLSLARVNLADANLTGAVLPQADLRGAYLDGAILSSANLPGADLSGARLIGVKVEDANLRGADLSGANLTSANFTLSDLCDVRLLDADLSYAVLTHSLLHRADLSRAILRLTTIGLTNLSETSGLDQVRFGGPCVLDYETLRHSEGLIPESFLRGCGWDDDLINYTKTRMNKTVDYYSCFISYSHADKVFAGRLYDELQRRGIRCWLDEKEINPGESISDAVDRGISLWDKVLLCCSRSSLGKSWWVQDEIGKALEKERRLQKKNRGKKVLALIPLDLDGYLFKWTDGKASTLRERLAPRFKGWESDPGIFDNQLELVVRALRTDGGKAPPPKSKI